MNTICRVITSTLGAAVIATMLAPSANAGCGNMMANPAPDLLKPAAFLRTVDRDDNDDAGIVGMWSVKFLVNGTMIDFGYSVWHSDGTEFLNSGGRAPATQNYCLGVWKQTGRSTYKLNHFGLSYDPGGTLNANSNIREDITLAQNGKTFTGTFTIDVYDPAGIQLLQHIAGQITGTRLTVN